MLLPSLRRECSLVATAAFSSCLLSLALRVRILLVCFSTARTEVSVKKMRYKTHGNESLIGSRSII
uniref:G protein-coupled receptor n=1 Tax=Parascaris univalens TaxID=6257 RepID=A0A915C911_PARUN